MVQQKADSSRYPSASVVVRDAPRPMDEQENLRREKLEQLRHDIRAGLDSGPAAEWDPDQVKREGRAKPHVNAGPIKS
jgi:antitoxin ParD1/3/4